MLRRSRELSGVNIPQQALPVLKTLFLRQPIDSLLAVVFPTACSICGSELSAARWINVCGDCWRSLKPWTGPACTRCGLPLASQLSTEGDTPGQQCASCRTGEYDFDLARSYGLYTGKLRLLILQLKFKRSERLGGKLGELLVDTWQAVQSGTSESSEVPLLIPVPLHASRSQERGFNQSELIAHGLAAQIRNLRELSNEGARAGYQRQHHRINKTPAVRVESRSLRRIRKTTPQSGLSLSARQQNVRGAFEVVRPELVRDRQIILVDDVMTTGATLSACAAVLKRAGARRVIALTVARVTPQFPDLVTNHEPDTAVAI